MFIHLSVLKNCTSFNGIFKVSKLSNFNVPCAFGHRIYIIGNRMQRLRLGQRQSLFYSGLSLISVVFVYVLLYYNFLCVELEAQGDCACLVDDNHQQGGSRQTMQKFEYSQLLLTCKLCVITTPRNSCVVLVYRTCVTRLT